MDLYISTEGASIAIQKNSFLVKTKEKSIILSPEKIETIILECNSSISTAAIKLAMEHNISILISDSYGNLVGHFCKLNYSKGAKLRRKQYELFVSKKGIEMARKWLIEKIEKQRGHINYLLKNRKIEFSEIVLFNQAIKKLNTIDISLENYREKIMGIEGSISKIYYKNISQLLDEKWKFEIREHRNAKKPYNIVLNYTLGILYRLIEIAIVKEGFDPALGIIHVEGEKKNSFVYDFIEKYRYLALESTFNLFNEKIVKQDFFENEINKKLILSIKGRRSISSYFKDVLKSGIKVKGKVFAIEDVIKSEIKKIKKELIDYEDDDLELKRDIKIEKEEVEEVAEDELFTFV